MDTFTKNINEIYTITLDFTSTLDALETIISSTPTVYLGSVEMPTMIDSYSIISPLVKVRLKGGIDDTEYLLRTSIYTTDRNVYIKDVLMTTTEVIPSVVVGATSIVDIANQVKKTFRNQHLPTTYSDLEYLEIAILGCKRFYRDTGIESSWTSEFSTNTLSRTLNIVEYQYCVVSAEIEMIKSLRMFWNTMVSRQRHGDGRYV